MTNQLPKLPTDGQITIGISGNRYRYFTTRNEWIDIGGSIASSIVNPEDNGFISPAISSLLKELRNSEVIDFKFDGAEESYYYLIRGKNRLFVTVVEGNKIRLELNRNALQNLLISNACQGPKGLQGPQGNIGLDGTTGSNEVTYTPTIDNTRLSISANVETPLDTEISARFQRGEQLIEIWYDLGSNSWTIERSVGFAIEDSSSVIIFKDGVFEADLISNEEWGDGWTAKIRQRGPKGLDGRDGKGFIEVFDSSLYSLKATDIIVSLRKSPSNHNIWMVKKPLEGDNLPASRLRPYGGRNIGDACITPIVLQFENADETSKILATEPSIDSNKRLRRWQFDPKSYDLDDANLPEWIPNPSCVRDVEYDWFGRFRGTSNQLWFDIKHEDPLPIKCCQEDFYFCPTIGDTPCEVKANGSWEWPPASPQFDKEPEWEIWDKTPKWLPL